MSRSNASHLHLCVNCGDDDGREDGRRDHAADHRYGNSLHHLGPGPVLHRIGSSPAIIAATVIIFGRTRSTAPSMIAV